MNYGRKFVNSKWVFKVKYKEDGSVDRFKAHVVAIGFTQVPGIDFGEPFSPVAHFSTIRTLLTLGMQPGMDIQQIDVGTTFLNGVFKADIYMSEGFKESGREKKSLYGLKQLPRCWYEELSLHLVTTGFKQSLTDLCVFCKWTDSKLVIISFHVDDLILLPDLIREMNALKKNLSLKF